MTTQAALAPLARDYLNMLRLARWTQRLPLAWQYRALARAAESRSPYRHSADRYARYAQRLGLADAAPSWRNALRNQGLFFANLSRFRADAARLDALVCRRDPAWDELKAEPGGALVLTFHHEFHHLLFVLLGRAGRKLRVIAAPEENSPLAPWLLPHIHRQHRDCAAHFRGGDYLFLDGPPQRDAMAVTRAFAAGETLLSLHDFSAGAMRSEVISLFGQRFAAPSGVLEIAMRLEKPIYFAALIWSWRDFGYHAKTMRLTPSAEAPLAAYALAMESLLQDFPAAWNGWQWLDDLGL